MIAISYAVWGVILVVITLLFYWLWKFAKRIESQEAEEQQWIRYIDQLWKYDPYNAAIWQNWFEERYMK